MSVSRLLLIGLDGLEPTLVRRWITSGDLPHLARLRDAGRWGPLRSTLPFATFPAWTSMMTGVNPGEHGVFDFARLIRGTYDVEFVGAAVRRRPSLPALASEAGLRVACVGFPATYPPEPINGIMIGGFDSPVAVSIDDSFVHPPQLAEELERRFGRYVFADFAETRSWLPGWHRRAARKLLGGLERRARIAHHLLDREPWDLFMVHFGESDTAAHHFWAFHDPSSPRHPGPRASAELQMTLQRVYMALDDAVGRLIAQAGDDAHVMIVSDHGFGGAGDKVLYLNRWLASHGWLTFTPRPGAAQVALGASIRAGLNLVPGRAQQWLWRAAGSLAGRAEARRRFAGIDWARTRAFSEELSYHPSIRLNRAGREPLGLVSDDRVQAEVDALVTALEALRDPWTGAQVVRRAWRREELYSGPAVDDAPELVLELALDDGYAYNLLSSGGPGPIWRRLAPRERLGAKGAGMNGTHRRDGFWLVHGPRVAPRRKRADMLDIAPTALAALGHLPPAWMEGRSHLPPDDRAIVVAPPSGGVTPERRPGSYTPAQQAVVEARLRRLGYL
ncbi:MAG: hypothetical protein CMH57_04940 [Myxococcales bacterium]|nr:hypothetical protein [Myxococcales bacterium]